MSRAALYVACSRATSISGLYIAGNFIPPKPFEITDPVKIELERLRLQQALTIHHSFVHDDEYSVKLFYQNVQSLNAHHKDIATDPTIMDADILCLVETWAFPEEIQSLEGYSLLSKLDCFNAEHEERSRNKKGISVYVKTDKISNVNLLFKVDHVLGYSFQYIAFRYHNIYIINLYRSPSFAEGLFRSFLKQAIDELQTHIRSEIKRILIIGDFNICRKTHPDNTTERLLIERGLVSHLHPTASTTKHGTQIDWVFSNIPLNHVNAKIYPTIHSHHDGVLVAT
ncbi:hypothetical protein CVS40_0059 [Lucilia cuprina]|nr:hypothetical protein CVS40_0059 [Lucilia cuprina]